MSDSPPGSQSNPAPTIIGWLLGLLAVGGGTLLLGFPFQRMLEEAGYSTLVGNLGVIAGAAVGMIAIVILNIVVTRWARSGHEASDEEW